MAPPQHSDMSTRAIVSTTPQPNHVPGSNWTLQDLTVTPPSDGEILVQMVATGICHTDLVMTSFPPGIPTLGIDYPKVAGHEGSGYIRALGPAVNRKDLAVGDPVLLSFDCCGACTQCSTRHPAYCEKFNLINMGGGDGVFKTPGGDGVQGKFFGQSSFAGLSVVREASVVNVKGLVKGEEELRLFAPLGCGFQTGAGTVVNFAKATREDRLVVLGLGGVGLAAMMAGVKVGCKNVIGVDLIASRLDLAKSLGATHTINSSTAGLDLAAEITKLTDGAGATIVIDTTGVPKVLEAGLAATGTRGMMILLGIPPPDYVMPVPTGPHLVQGKILTGSVEGDVMPEEFVPKMIEWYREGSFPIDRLVKYYKVEEFETALHDVHKGETIKATLTF